jgi:hypothetical protein
MPGGMPGGMPTMPGMPSDMPGMPGGMPSMPGGMPSMPGGMPSMPGGMPSMPGGMPSIPGGMPSDISSMSGGMPNMSGGVYKKKSYRKSKIYKSKKNKYRNKTSKRSNSSKRNGSKKRKVRKTRKSVKVVRKMKGGSNNIKNSQNPLRKFISSYEKDKTNNKNVHILLDNEKCSIEIVILLFRIIKTYFDDKNENENENEKIREQYSLIGVRTNKNGIVKNDMYTLYLIKKQNPVIEDEDKDEDEDGDKNKFMFQYPYKNIENDYNVLNGKYITDISINNAISDMEYLINENKNHFSISKTYFDEIMKKLYFNSLTNHSNA